MKTPTAVVDLGRTPIFSGLGEEKLEKIASIVKVREFPSDQIVIKEGESGDSVFILLSGEVEVSKSLVLRWAGASVDPRDKSLTRLSSKSYPFFGEMSLFDKQSARSATVRTATPCKFAVINLVDFVKLAESDYEIGYRTLLNIAWVLSDRLNKTNNDLLKVTTALGIALEK
ncbi:MAG: cyclic nucleotide-binding domain-containing protein [Bacteroidetes bacterium]|nr:cyclic nucleotide-binding domain-containing protein [Bacteroidota bacterium]MCL5737554.1 cyclic nucleotide-binding domain-containing protein [Bacteroidota bacterium]